MIIKYLKQGVRLVMPAIIFLFVGMGVIKARQAWPCVEPPKHSYPKLFRNKQGKPTQLKTKELMERVTHCVPPALFGSADQKGIVIVDILINPAGKVACVKPRTGPPLLQAPVIKAVKQWAFKPVKVKGKNVPALGELEFYLSWDKSWACPGITAEGRQR